MIDPPNVVVPSDQTITLPPVPRSRADASMTVAWSIVTVEALAIARFSSCARGCENSVVSGLPPAQSPPISTVPPPAGADTSMRAPAISMFSPVMTTRPPCRRSGPLLPGRRPAVAEAESVPETRTVWRGASAGREPAVAAPSTIMPLRRPIVFASMTPRLLMTESTTWRAAAAVSSTRPPLALIRPAFSTSEVSGRPVCTSRTWAPIWSPTASEISLSP